MSERQPPMFISGESIPTEVRLYRESAVEQLTDGAEGRWGEDHKALVQAAYEAGWDDAMLYWMRRHTK